MVMWDNVGSPAFARLLVESEWIVESRNGADYMDVRESVKARRRQKQSICFYVMRFHAPLAYGWT